MLLHSLVLVQVFSSPIGVPFVWLCCSFCRWKSLLRGLLLLLRMLLLLLILWVCYKMFQGIRVVLVLHWLSEVCHTLCFLALWRWFIVRERIHMYCMCRFLYVDCFGDIFLVLLVQLIGRASSLFLYLLHPTGICQRTGLEIRLFYIRFPSQFFASGFLCLFSLPPFLIPLV